LHKEINAADLRKYICSKLLENIDVVVPGLAVSPLEFFNTTYGLDAQNREKIVNPHLSVEQRSPCTFKDYVEAMMHPNTYADNLIVAFSSNELKVSMTVYTCSRTSVFMEVPTEEVWRAEPYGSGNLIHINLINNYDHFQLVMDLKPMDLKPRVRLPEIECIFDEDSKPLPHLHHEPPYFGNTQLPSRKQFYDTCTNLLKPIFPELPQNLHIKYQIEQGADPDFLASLIDSFEFPEFNLVRYRIIAFHFNDGKLVSHTGCIEDLSYGNVKRHFFAQIFEKNSTIAVHSIVLQRC
jgi:hypothetical protein